MVNAIKADYTAGGQSLNTFDPLKRKQPDTLCIRLIFVYAYNFIKFVQ